MNHFTLEICAYSFTAAKAAQNGGAQRVELCNNMAEGGTTPSYAQIKCCTENLNIEIWPIIRPRGGDFLYNEDEFLIMLEDIKICKQLKCHGIVTGILKADGKLDEERNQQLIKMACPLPVALHRAFDMTRNLSEALETAIKLGFVRILTSGGQKNALAGAQQIKTLIAQAQHRIQLMPGAGITTKNIKEISQITDAQNFHSSAKVLVNSQMHYQNKSSQMGNDNTDFMYYETDTAMVHNLIKALSA